MTIQTVATRSARVLVVDDDPSMCEVVADSLGADGCEVETTADGLDAAEMIARGEYDVVVSDICLPGMDGLRLLRAVRLRDAELPVILMTGDPTLESAVEAVELGALRYLVKPFSATELRRVVQDGVRHRRLARVRRAAQLVVAEDRAQSEAGGAFGRALDTLQMAFQPIVQLSSGTIHGYEALARPREPSLPHPGALFDAAERLGRLTELGRVIRDRVAGRAGEAPAGLLIFVNLHSRDLQDETLYDAAAELTKLAHRVVLEVTERAELGEAGEIRRRAAHLRRLGFRLALDDMGAGYAGLNSLTLLEPEYVKLDMVLVRGIAHEPIKRKIVSSMIQLCADMGKLVIAEGVETAEERDTLRDLGCDLLQGFLFGRPQERFGDLSR